MLRPAGLVAVAELAQLALAVVDAKEERATQIVFGARHRVGGVASAAGDLAVFQRKSRRDLHLGRWFHADLVAVFAPDDLARITNRTVVATEASVLLSRLRLGGFVDQQRRLRLFELGRPFEVACRAIAAAFDEVLGHLRAGCRRSQE